MKSEKRKITVLMLLGIIFTISVAYNLNFNLTMEEINKSGQIGDEIRLKKAGFWNLTGSPITIDGDATGVGAHNWSWVELQDWFGGGNGTKNNPYIIENITINGQGTGSCIEIRDSNLYFVIRNCTVYNSGDVLNTDTGIKLYNTSKGFIINNNCSNNGDSGILLSNYCTNNTISGNIARNNTIYGLRLINECDDNIISNNNFNDNAGGIDLEGNCDNNFITDNLACDIQVGLQLYNDCDNNTISRNVISYNIVGIIVQTNCDNNTIAENYMYLSSMYDIEIVHANCIDNIIERNVFISGVGEFVHDQGSNTSIGINYILPVLPALSVHFLNQSFSTTEFVLVFNISSGLNFNPWILSIQAWWNGIVVPSANITKLGNYSYKLSLKPITVVPGDEPILLNMTISSATHEEKNFGIFLAVDPATLNKIQPGDEDGDGIETPGIPGYDFLILIGALCVMSAILIKKKPK